MSIPVLDPDPRAVLSLRPKGWKIQVKWAFRLMYLLNFILIILVIVFGSYLLRSNHQQLSTRYTNCNVANLRAGDVKDAIVALEKKEGIDPTKFTAQYVVLDCSNIK